MPESELLSQKSPDTLVRDASSRPQPRPTGTDTLGLRYPLDERKHANI